FLVSSNVTDALVADGARDPGALHRKVRRTSLQTALVLVPGVAFTVAAAPAIMALFGSGYTGEAVTTLRLLALAAVPNAVSTVVVAVAHVRQRISTVIAIQVTMSVLSLGASWALLDVHGIVGVAWAWLGAQSATAVLAVVLAVRSEAGLRRAAVARLVARVSALRSAGARRRAGRLLGERLGSLPAEVGELEDVSLLAHQHDLLVLRGQVDRTPVVVRLAAGAQGRRGIAAHRSQLQALHADDDLAPLHPLIPRVLRGDPGATWLVETMVTGSPVASSPAGASRDRAVAAGLAVLDRLHGATARRLVVGPELVALWVHEPVATVAEVVDDPRAVRGLAALHRRLREELIGTRVTVARLHGDPSLDNLLVADDGSAVTGMVDWESSTIGLPECDLMVLVLARRVAHGGELGAEVLDLLASGWSAEERALLGTSWSLNDHVRPTTAVLLTWLAHVAANLEKTDRYRANRWWVRHNVEDVLASLDDGTPVPSALDHAPVAGTDVPDVGDRPAEPPAVADALAPALAGTRARLSDRALRVGVVAATAAAWAATTWGAPVAVRVALVLAATVVLPAVVLGRCLGTPGPLVHGVIGVAGAVSAGVLLAEAQLYAGLWSPTLWAVLIGATTLALSLRIPPYQPARPTPATPADAIVRRTRSSKAVA
ncbi:MAG TPA: phosphotransferase, partial [Aquihabitans sp.]|nr:phosphotransferase [Aquihabitans sp.]